MTTTASIPNATTADTDGTREAIAARMGRGLELFEARGSEIVRTSASTYLVPGSDPRGGYVVNYSCETCECRDFEFAGLGVCKHLAAVGCLRAARRAEAAGHLAVLEDRARREDLDPDERLELLDRIRRGRRLPVRVICALCGIATVQNPQNGVYARGSSPRSGSRGCRVRHRSGRPPPRGPPPHTGFQERFLTAPRARYRAGAPRFVRHAAHHHRRNK